MMPSQRQILLILCSFAFAFLLQTVRINRPFVGHFATYQGTVMAGIAQNMQRENFQDLIRPKTNTIIGSDRSLHLNQYPLPALMAAWANASFGGGLELWGRLQAILFNSASLLLIFLLGQRLLGTGVGVLSAILFALSPYAIVYGQSFISEPSALFFFLISLWLLLSKKTEYLSWSRSCLAGLLFSLTLISRFHWLVFYLVYMAVYFRLVRENRISKFILFGVTSVTLPIFWYGHTYYAALEADNVHTSLFMQLSAQGGAKSAYWLADFEFYRRLLRVLLRTSILIFIPFLIIGLIASRKKEQAIVLQLGVLSTLAIIVLAPKKVVDHEFYLYGGYPFLIILSAAGLFYWTERFGIFKKPVLAALATLIYAFLSFLLVKGPLFDQPPEELHAVSVGKAIREKTRPEDRLIVLSDGPGIFIYYAERPAWPLQPNLIGVPLAPYQKATQMMGNDPKELAARERARQDAVLWFDYLRKQGANYLVVPSNETLNRLPVLRSHLDSNYQALTNSNDAYSLYQL